ncbi:UDP-glycosyltransferase 74G1 [Mucuna pruriens]|uniref:Glycosyltransferase n=1 Tax=Mucuna pruriens TaxID=157652 RepID=A0A371IG31_MUCPR|nr:UDP-glycosyltransferase 74G1 [Mucuna pruriens]
MVHCVVLPFPIHGHINPMHEFSKLLQREGVRITLVTTLSYCKNLQKIPASIALETISDGFDNGGIAEAGSWKTYLESFWQVGPKTFAELLEKLGESKDHVDCVIYDSFFPWALDVAKRFGIVGAVFLTQNMTVNSIYYHVNLGMLRVPLTQNEISLPLLPKLQLEDMPSFFFPTDVDNPVLLDLLVAQFSNIDKADWILCNSIYEMEKEINDWMKKIWSKFRTIGPCITSMILNKQLADDEDHGVTQFKSEECIKWLDDKPKQSVVYVSFGSMAILDEEQIKELAYGLEECGSYFLWVVRTSEENKLPKDFKKKSKKGLIVGWCSQLKVLAHEAIACFVTHCGWNSTLEALSLGVPMVAVPYWSDQNTNAKQIVDAWKVGIRATVDEKKIVRGEMLKYCIMEIMKSKRGKEMKSNMMQWKALAAGAVTEEGSSHKNIAEFVNNLFNLKGIAC